MERICGTGSSLIATKAVKAAVPMHFESSISHSENIKQNSRTGRFTLQFCRIQISYPDPSWEPNSIAFRIRNLNTDPDPDTLNTGKKISRTVQSRLYFL